MTRLAVALAVLAAAYWLAVGRYWLRADQRRAVRLAEEFLGYAPTEGT